LLIAVVMSWEIPSAAAAADAPFRFPEGEYGKGELKYRHGIPVMVVAGTPQEIGAQVAVLAGKASVRLQNYPKDLLSLLATPAGMKLVWPTVTRKGFQLLENFPAAYREELETMIQVGRFDRGLVVAGNTAFDLRQDLGHLFGCSALIVEAARSENGQPFFGRNMDHFSCGYLHEYSLVTVYRPKGKHAFVAIGFPGLVGCISGMNDAGLALAVLDTTGAPAEEGPAFNIKGVPFALCYRRLLEECSTVGQAAAALRTMTRASSTNLVVCDRNGGAVFEITPSRVVVRRSTQGIGVCTNHFCADELKLRTPRNLFKTLDRFAALEKARAGEKKLGVENVRLLLDTANQGKLTLQTMVFEPSNRRIHVAFMEGEAPASGLKLKTLAVAPLFANEDSGKAENRRAVNPR
jgi:hypothetical protein